MSGSERLTANANPESMSGAPFFVSIKEIVVDPDVVLPASPTGLDELPKMGQSLYVPNKASAFLWNDAMNEVNIAAMPPNTARSTVRSVYFWNGSIFVLPYDATEKRADEHIAGWQALSFNRVLGNGDGSIASVGYGYTYQRMEISISPPRWVVELLAPAHVQTTNEMNRGVRYLIGEVAIILALIALAVPSSEVPAAVKWCFQQANYHGNGKPDFVHLRQDRRGVVVRIWPDPIESEMLRRLQDGCFGPILS